MKSGRASSNNRPWAWFIASTAARRQPRRLQPPVRRSRAGGPVGSRRQAGRTSAAPAAGQRRGSVRAYASGLDFHLSDSEYTEFFGHAASPAMRPSRSRSATRISSATCIASSCSGRRSASGAWFMIDANEAWGAKEALVKLTAIRDAGFALMWVEDPILRDDFEGLRMLRRGAPWTHDQFRRISRCRRQAAAHGRRRAPISSTSTARSPTSCGSAGSPPNSASRSALGNTFLEVGVHMACALPEVEWLEYSFQNFEHLVEQPMEIRDGWIAAPDRPGHGLVLSRIRAPAMGAPRNPAARRAW